MKTKMEISLNERDALRDMLAAEDRLLAGYAAAIAAGDVRPVRRQLGKLFSEQADTQLRLLMQMSVRGYLGAAPASAEEIKACVQSFGKEAKQLSRLLL